MKRLAPTQPLTAEEELEAVRRDLCQFCLASTQPAHDSPVPRYSAAYRKHRKNGVLIRWEHVFDGNKDNALRCLAGASREREYQAKHAGVWKKAI
jgi:hypothetical protein